MKKIITTLFIIAAIGGGIGFYMFNKTAESTTSMKSDFTMTASELLNEFEIDENSANAKYLDKVIEVNGKVEKLENNNEHTTIYIGTHNPLSSLIFQLENSETNIKVGDQVTLKGICTGYLMDVVLVRAVKI